VVGRDDEIRNHVGVVTSLRDDGIVRVMAKNRPYETTHGARINIACQSNQVQRVFAADVPAAVRAMLHAPDTESVAVANSNGAAADAEAMRLVRVL
jgi:hypothetical protein